MSIDQTKEIASRFHEEVVNQKNLSALQKVKFSSAAINKIKKLPC